MGNLNKAIKGFTVVPQAKTFTLLSVVTTKQIPKYSLSDFRSSLHA